MNDANETLADEISNLFKLVPNMIDDAVLNFSADKLFLLNISLGIIMFGVAINLTIEDFKRVIRAPKSALAGMLSQFIILPMLTFILVWILKPQPSLALGMMLVAACPGGNISNFMSSMAKGNGSPFCKLDCHFKFIGNCDDTT